MKRFLIGLTLLASMSSFAGIDLSQSKGNHCVVYDDSPTPVLKRDMITSENSYPLYGSNDEIQYYADTLYNKDGVRFGISVHGHDGAGHLTMDITKTINGRFIQSIRARHKSFFALSDEDTGLLIKCNE
ncbi:MAG: hypothetical protein ACJAS4_001475 [Bacteriovoracaceae bacterium]|jgi:hypothetical protein